MVFSPSFPNFRKIIVTNTEYFVVSTLGNIHGSSYILFRVVGNYIVYTSKIIYKILNNVFWTPLTQQGVVV
uniref:Putative ovule protein n=1 Tax=Solanum chacoense TaxID=4108 RepID=A0A0V0HFM3_SOLCH